MRMPYQCMARCGDILVAARGSSIDSFTLRDGSFLSTWKCPSSQESTNGQVLDGASGIATKLIRQASEPSPGEITVDAAPPARKRRLSQSEQLPVQLEAKSGKKKQNNRSAAVASGLEAPAVITLASTSDGKHVIAATGEDKSIRVFESVFEDGTHQLRQLSSRNMPKRPCTLAITNDNGTIISADKFGDVYALPLLPSEDPAKPQNQTPPASCKPFIPAANELTIHSLRNRKALENQKKHGNKAPEKSEPTFKHKLLLGHVSMLTDVALGSAKNNNYVLTADRDEHIRISRGTPQTHIIEGFCLGHTEFISRLCIPSSRPDILISAGGDDDLFVWRWVSGTLVLRTNLKKHVDVLRRKLGNGETVEKTPEQVKIAVSGLYHIRRHVDDHPVDHIIVTCEGISALFLFSLHVDTDALDHIQTFELPGNPLAAVNNVPLSASCGVGGVVVSVDTIHRPGSTIELRDEILPTEKPLLSIQLCDTGFVPSDVLFEVPADDGESLSNMGQLQGLLYNLENLRKRDGDGQDE